MLLWWNHADFFFLSSDFEIEEEEYENTRDLYLRLLERTEHVKVYISFAQFELSIPYKNNSEEGNRRARKIYEDAYDNLKKKELKEEVSCDGQMGIQQWFTHTYIYA